MAIQKAGVYEKIMLSARKEFLEKGFTGASLRTISKNAGVTTGTIYSRFEDKTALFEEIVGEHAKKIVSIYNNGIDSYYNFNPEDKYSKMNDLTVDCISLMLDVIYGDYECSKILICSSKGTCYENFIHEMIQKEVDSTEDFARTMYKLGKIEDEENLDKGLFHMIASGFMSSFFEIVAHDMDRKVAERRIALLRKFYTGGWSCLFNVDIEHSGR
ncbi:TetR/AcrR family transcriptional regulator [Treponema sp.]|uniref:TetR/AcrR family transcriptional regulator n=1 Tax=Treponema sp. TaxID=166 RepID=UPI0025E37083|nr:TetR/AcrR family transcriptional regulator [Treponema sp.]MCR5217431.1 TetR/AcrR family transcriptional regulator [Treponema sp.]